jgi:hypothetical protein
MVLILLVPYMYICHKIIYRVKSVYMKTAIALLSKVHFNKVFDISALCDKC